MVTGGRTKEGTVSATPLFTGAPTDQLSLRMPPIPRTSTILMSVGCSIINTSACHVISSYYNRSPVTLINNYPRIGPMVILIKPSRGFDKFSIKPQL